ncbi:MAG TPA: UvrD-helicase domain-containing protein [Gemmatimonadota bacterium]
MTRRPAERATAAAPLDASGARAWPPDRAVRQRITRELDANILVEAGAGSGKTRQLVARMLALVRRGTAVEHLAAVTFTRKAAAELAQRFRNELEAASREAAAAGAPGARALDEALRNVDRAFIGTIHAFCARLLREHPVEARVDPGFEELGEAEAKRFAAEFWTWHLDRRHALADPVLTRLDELGLEPADLRDAFDLVVEDSDLAHPAPETPPPDVDGLRDRLLQLMDEAFELLARKPAGAGEDDLQKRLLRLRFLHRTTGWATARDLCAALPVLSKSACKPTQRDWASDADGKRRVKDLGERFAAFVEGPAAEALRAWRAHRYPAVIAFLDPLAADFREHRRRAGRLTFQDLLQFAADLLREQPDVRRSLGRRWRHLLVDEFQDTDPLQAEVCFLLASDPEEGADWRRVTPRPGALFLVGDPKQSIYRFRRADIRVYEQVRRRFEQVGEVLPLTANFRSAGAIGRFTDAAFARLLESGGRSEIQAPFAPLETDPARDAEGRVWQYRLDLDGSPGLAEVAEADAPLVAGWIASRVAQGRSAGDFLVLPWRKVAVASYARELERRGLPVTTSGAGLTVDRELRELVVLLQGLADPQDATWTVAALEGLFFGLSPLDLWEHRRAGGSFSFERSAFTGGSPVEAALERMSRWARLFREESADAALAAVVRDLGLVPLAAAGSMAESRAGSLVHALDVVAAAASRGSADLRSALEAIEGASEATEVEAPLRPGRPDAVRVMNLHKAKGLEAPIVVLPHPTGVVDLDVVRHVRRPPDGPAEAYLRVIGDRQPLAEPADWEALAAEEKRWEEAEGRRLLYVAVTRAGEELVVARCEATAGRSPWRALEVDLDRFAESLTPTPGAVSEGPVAGVSLDELTETITAVDRRRESCGEPAYAAAAVTAGPGEALLVGGGEGRGREWGALVHRALAGMGRGRRDEALRRFVRALLMDAERPVDAGGEPRELEELLELLEAVRGSDAWQRLAAGPRELTLARLEREPGGTARLLTGAIDALALGPDGRPTLLVDWKTDAVDGAEWEARRLHYGQQIETYGVMVQALTGSRPESELVRVR